MLLPFMIFKVVIMQIYNQQSDIIFAAFLHGERSNRICNTTEWHSLLLTHLDDFLCHIFFWEGFI